MLPLPNFGQLNTSIVEFKSRNKTLLMLVKVRNYDVVTLISKYNYFK